VVPNSFLARTRTLIVWPISELRNVNAGRFPPMPWHPPPLVLQRNHWYAKEVGPLFHEPALAASVWPALRFPLIVGAEVFCGGLPSATTSVADDVASAEPEEFDAVTDTRRRRPASLLESRRVWLVAPEILEHPLPFESQRSQR
jgi:hypothetical protein